MGEVVALEEEDIFRHSGRELPHGCTDVWAIPLFRGSRAHFYKRDGCGYTSLCGQLVPAFLSNGQNHLFGAGTYPKCKRCMDTLRKGAANGR